MNQSSRIDRKAVHEVSPIRIVLAVIALFTLFKLNAQPENWEIRNYTTVDGLSSNDVRVVVKDHQGFLWMGAGNGLNRFDGQSFTRLVRADGSLHPISTAKILDLLVDRDGVLWAGTIRGMYRYDPTLPVDSIRHYTYFGQESAGKLYSKQPVNAITEDSAGFLWMICLDFTDWTNFGLRRFNKKRGEFEHLRIDSTFNQGEVSQVDAFVMWTYTDSKGETWLGTSSGLCRYDRDLHAFHTHVPFPGDSYKRHNGIGFCYEDRNGNFWVSSMYGIFLFDRENHEFGEMFKLDEWPILGGTSSSISAMSEDASGNLWMMLNYTLSRSPPVTGDRMNADLVEKWHYTKKSHEGGYLGSLLADGDQIWFSVLGSGVYRVNLKRNGFMTLIPDVGEYAGDFGVNKVSAVYADTGKTLWMAASDDGIIRLNRESGAKEFCQIGHVEMFNGIDRDQYGNLWFVSRYGLAFRMSEQERESFSVSLYGPDPSDPGSLSMRTEFPLIGVASISYELDEHLLIKDREGVLWFNSGTGIHDRYEVSIDGFKHLDHPQVDHVNNDTLVDDQVAGEIWFPSPEGLYRVLPPFSEGSSNNLFPDLVIRYQHDPGDATSLSASWTSSLLFSTIHEPGTLWIGTIGGGLNKLVFVREEDAMYSRATFRRFTTADGLCDNNILGILEDDDGRLWLSTQNGLSEFDPESEVFRNFYQNDGLATDMFSWSAPGKGSDGRMYFPTHSGLVSFHPDKIRVNPIPPPVVITGFRLFNETVHPGDNSPLSTVIHQTRLIELAYNQNFIAFEFAALNFVLPEKNQYRYILEGLDDHWIQAGTRGYAEYTSLKPGRYTFRVTGSNNDGVWNETGTSINIFIHPPPWKQWWAYTLYGLFLITIIMLYRRFLLNRARLRSEVELERMEKQKVKEVEQLKSRFFTNVSHEFRTPLTLILGPVEDLQSGSAKEVVVSSEILQIIHRNARRLQGLINQLLDFARMEAGEVRLQVSQGFLNEAVRTIASSFLSAAESKHIDYKIIVPEEDPPRYFDRNKLETILSNLISNAFKFTKANGGITVVLEYSETENDQGSDMSLITVSDTGAGIPRDKLGKIFDRFYQVESPDQQDLIGTGIGLSMVKDLVEVYRGQIEVESKEGEGTVFRLKLPVERDSFRSEEVVIGDPQPDRPAKDHPRATDSQGRKPTRGPKALDRIIRDPLPLVLVVEDNKDLREYVSGILDSEFRVEEAVNGIKGLEKTIKLNPDLVITDLMMPRMDGMELCRKLRENEHTCHVPIIMLTAKADRDSKLDGWAEGADDYIIKPFDSKELSVRVKNLIEQRKLLRERFRNEFLPDRTLPGPSKEDPLLQDIITILQKHVPDPDFRVDQMAEEMHMSRTQLYSKVTAMTGIAPIELLRMIRMREAARLLVEEKYNITQVMYRVGMQNTSHFARTFRSYFQVNPSEYKRSGR